jgi:hypothetical protein
MPVVKVQVVIGDKVVSLDPDGVNAHLYSALLAACKTKRDFGGLEYSDPEYGIVKVTIGSGDKAKEYTVQIGNWEWELAERAFSVKGVDGVIKAWESEKNQTEFCRIALSRHHKDLKPEAVALLRDWKSAEGRFALKDAVDKALVFSKPHRFPDEEVDPKALEAAGAAMLLASTMAKQESPSTT